MKQGLKAQKKELINFIMWKMSSNSDEERKEVMKEIKNKSYQNLREWAIRNDFID